MDEKLQRLYPIIAYMPSEDNTATRSVYFSEKLYFIAEAIKGKIGDFKAILKEEKIWV